MVSSMRRRLIRLGAFAFGVSLLAASVSLARSSSQDVYTFNDLTRYTPEQLDAIFVNADVGNFPAGKVRGRALIRPGTKLGPLLSKSAGIIWQGKVFSDDDATVINRFFGLKMIRGEVFQGTSWRDGAPATIVDYQRTSKVYGRYRDELREISPGLWLGVMYERSNPPTVKMHFAIQSRN